MDADLTTETARADDSLRDVAKASHTPDSFARALVDAVLRDLSATAGPLDERTLHITATMRLSGPPRDSPPKADPVHPHATVCLHLPSSDLCMFWPPIIVY